MTKPSCLVCGSPDLETCLLIPGLPISSQRFEARAVLARGRDFRLDVCHHCGHLQNGSGLGSPLDQEGIYLFSLAHSPQARGLQQSLSRWIMKDLKAGSRVLEVGCGDGYFLRQFAENGFPCLGYENSGSLDLLLSHPHLKVNRSLFSPERHEDPQDLVIFRHVLEHLPNPLAYLRALRSPYLYVEVPRAEFICRNRMFFDLYNDHLSYFSSDSLTRLLQRAGYTPHRFHYPDQHEYLGVLAKRGDVACAQVEKSHWLDEVHSFCADYRNFHTEAKTKILELFGATEPIDYWGAGSRGLTMLHSLGIGRRIRAVIDSDATKKGKFIPGFPLSISAPSDFFVRKDPPRNLIVSSYTFKNEIASMIRKNMRDRTQMKALTVNPLEELRLV